MAFSPLKRSPGHFPAANGTPVRFGYHPIGISRGKNQIWRDFRVAGQGLSNLF